MPAGTLVDYVVVFVFGTLVGSFANVCIYRVPQRLSVVFPGSYCPCCQEALRAWHNIPFLSYVLLGGRCATCKSTIPHLWRRAWLRGHGLGRGGRTLACSLGLHPPGNPQEAVAEQIEARTCG